MLALGLAAGGMGLAGSAASSGGSSPCRPATVQYTPYLGTGSGLSSLPWVAGKPGPPGLVGLLWYWPEKWRTRQVRAALIFAGGHVDGPRSASTKILWVFTAPEAKGLGGIRLTVRGRRLDRPGAFRQSFVAISYKGQNEAPSYASIVTVPKPGCWRLDVSTRSLRSSVVFRAIPRMR